MIPTNSQAKTAHGTHRPKAFLPVQSKPKLNLRSMIATSCPDTVNTRVLHADFFKRGLLTHAGPERVAVALPAAAPSLEPPHDALAHFQAVADKVSAVTFFSRIKRAPVTRVSLGRDVAAGPWKYDLAALRTSGEAPERAGALESPAAAAKSSNGNYFGEGPVSPGVVRKARGVIGPGGGFVLQQGGDIPGDARAAAGTTSIERKVNQEHSSSRPGRIIAKI